MKGNEKQPLRIHTTIIYLDAPVLKNTQAMLFHAISATNEHIFAKKLFAFDLLDLQRDFNRY